MSNGVTDSENLCPWKGFYVGQDHATLVAHDHEKRPISGGVVPLEPNYMAAGIPLKELVSLKEGNLRTRLTRIGYRIPE